MSLRKRLVNAKARIERWQKALERARQEAAEAQLDPSMDPIDKQGYQQSIGWHIGRLSGATLELKEASAVMNWIAQQLPFIEAEELVTGGLDPIHVAPNEVDHHQTAIAPNPPSPPQKSSGQEGPARRKRRNAVRGVESGPVNPSKVVKRPKATKRPSSPAPPVGRRNTQLLERERPATPMVAAQSHQPPTAHGLERSTAPDSPRHMEQDSIPLRRSKRLADRKAKVDPTRRPPPPPGSTRNFQTVRKPSSYEGRPTGIRKDSSSEQEPR